MDAANTLLYKISTTLHWIHICGWGGYWVHCHFHETSLRWFLLYWNGVLSYCKNWTDDGKLWPWRGTHGLQQYLGKLRNQNVDWLVLGSPKCAWAVSNCSICLDVLCICRSFSVHLSCQESLSYGMSYCSLSGSSNLSGQAYLTSFINRVFLSKGLLLLVTTGFLLGDVSKSWFSSCVVRYNLTLWVFVCVLL